MKIVAVSLLSIVLLGTAFGPRTNAELPDAPAPALSHPGDLDRLNAEYDRKRAGALRPVTAWYRAQLEVLGKKLEGDSKALDAARAKLNQTFWADDQPELKHALLSGDWIWRSAEDADGVSVKFSEDGSARHSGMNGSWKITGPGEVTVFPDDDGRYILRFHASLKSFTGDRRGVTGERQPPE